MTTIDRAASAIFQKFRVEEAEPPSVTWADHAVHSYQHEAYRGAAREVLKSMLEPTETQMQIFRHFFGFNPFVKDGGPADQLFANAYRQAIEAALSEQEGLAAIPPSPKGEHE